MKWKDEGVFSSCTSMVMASYLCTKGVSSGAGERESCRLVSIAFWNVVSSQNTSCSGSASMDPNDLYISRP